MLSFESKCQQSKRIKQMSKFCSAFVLCGRKNSVTGILCCYFYDLALEANSPVWGKICEVAPLCKCYKNKMKLL